VSKISQLDGGAISSGTRSAVDGIAPAKAVGSGAAGAGSTDPSGTDSSDSVSITESGRALAALSQAVQDAPEIDGARVAALKQAITSGSYSIDDEVIAARMLKIDQDLHGKAR
jgi:negative regulator of flagellin synthesis FlgM